MPQTTKNINISTAEAFYCIFKALPKEDRFAVVRYILEDEEIQRNFDFREVPNKLTLEAFAEEVSQMPAFTTIDDLRKDLLS